MYVSGSTLVHTGILAFKNASPAGENWINYDFPGYDPQEQPSTPSRSKRRFRVLPRQQLKGALQRNGFPAGSTRSAQPFRSLRIMIESIRKLGSTRKHGDLGCKVCMGQTFRPVPKLIKGKLIWSISICLLAWDKTRKKLIKNECNTSVAFAFGYAFRVWAGIPPFDFQALNMCKKIGLGHFECLATSFQE